MDKLGVGAMPYHFVLKYLLLFIIASFTSLVALAEDKVRVGVLISMSDEWAGMGKATVRGIEMATADVNAAGGVNGKKVEILVEDTQEANSGARAVSAFRSLRQRGVNWFIGPSGTPGAMSLAPIVAVEPVIMITPTVGVRDFSDAGENIFNSRGIDEKASATMAHLAFERGWRKAAVLASQQPWEQAQGEAFFKNFELLGGTISSVDTPLPETSDFRALIAKLLLAKPDVIFLSNYNRMGVAAKQLAELGYKGPKLTTTLDNNIVQSATGTLNDAEFASFVGPTEAFRKRFHDKYGDDPDLGSDTGYDAMYAIAQALKESASMSLSDVKQQLNSIEFEGASGHFSFDNDRIAIRQLKRFLIRNGKIGVAPKEK